MEVNWFITKIRNRALNFGILLAAKGITGSAQDRDEAHHVVSQALKDGVRMIIITRTSWKVIVKFGRKCWKQPLLLFWYFSVIVTG